MKTFLRSFLRARMAAIGLTALAGILIPVIYFLLGVSNDFSVVFQPFGEDAFQANTKDYSLVLTDRQVRINGSEWAIQLPENAGPARKGGEVWYDDLYNGIDLRFYDKGSGRAGYDLILEPGTHPDKIRLELKGEGTAYIDGNGELVLPAAEGEIRHSAPYAYQEIDGEKIPVQSKFALVSKEL
ncbi:MAG: hypothetical protein KDD12_27305, partial [Lewinella sp.]|nr:hypothetical protein [Lewinella sp.]